MISVANSKPAAAEARAGIDCLQDADVDNFVECFQARYQCA
jgi:hypothetical protein